MSSDSVAPTTSEPKIDCVYYLQACSNENLLASIEEHTPTDFYDWRATIIFYSALHYLKSYAKTKGITLVDHRDTFKKLYSKGKGLPPELIIDTKVRWCYDILFKFAHATRYDGYFKENVSGKVGKLRLKDAKEYLALMKDWIIPRLND